METIYKLEDFVVSHMFRPYAQDFICADFVNERNLFESIQKAIESNLRRKPEHIIDLLEKKPETKERVFDRIKKFGGIKFYKYLNMDLELIKYIKRNLGMEK